MKVLVLGAGKMTEAILLGLRGAVDLSDFHIYSPSGISAERLAKQLSASHVTDVCSVTNPDFILVGCKPQQLLELKKVIGDQFNTSTFISMLAALTETQQLKILGASRLIRIMPNLPVQYRKGVTLVSSHSAQGDCEKVKELLTHLGRVIKVSEEELEELTILTGSGPALFYEFTRSLSNSFLSLDSEARESLARAVLEGAAMSAASSDDSLSELIDAVTSKGGVTRAVLDEWSKVNFVEVVTSGVTAGKNRSQELKQTIPQN